MKAFVVILKHDMAQNLQSSDFISYYSQEQIKQIKKALPVDFSLSNYRCILADHFLQNQVRRLPDMRDRITLIISTGSLFSEVI